ncbi:hypothetical protein E4L96_06680, partial [Massilia arenosa]
MRRGAWRVHVQARMDEIGHQRWDKWTDASIAPRCAPPGTGSASLAPRGAGGASAGTGGAAQRWAQDLRPA